MNWGRVWKVFTFETCAVRVTQITAYLQAVGDVSYKWPFMAVCMGNQFCIYIVIICARERDGMMPSERLCFPPRSACLSTATRTWWTPTTWPSVSAPPWCLSQRATTRSPARPMSTSSSRQSSYTTAPSSPDSRTCRAPSTSPLEVEKISGKSWGGGGRIDGYEGSLRSNKWCRVWSVELEGQRGCRRLIQGPL